MEALLVVVVRQPHAVVVEVEGGWSLLQAVVVEEVVVAELD